MKRPNRNEDMPNNNFQGTYKVYNDASYLVALELYANFLESEIKLFNGEVVKLREGCPYQGTCTFYQSGKNQT